MKTIIKDIISKVRKSLKEKTEADPELVGEFFRLFNEDESD